MIKCDSTSLPSVSASHEGSLDRDMSIIVPLNAAFVRLGMSPEGTRLLIGRDAVLDEMRRCGNSAMEENTPFLSTREFFALIGAPTDVAARYATATTDQRASILESLKAGHLPAVGDASRAAPDSVGWFGTAADLANVLACIQHTALTGADSTALTILAINHGPIEPSPGLPLVGYKGGNLTGVLTYTTIARSASGGWYAIAVIWNGSVSDVKELRLAPFFRRAAAILAER